jgi:glutathione S-transferase
MTALPTRLITIPFSHFCEKARWALDRAGVDFVEDKHVPGFHLRATRPRGGRSVPLLCAGSEVVRDSTDILHWVDARLSPAQRLFPSEPALRAEVERLEDRFDEVLGPHLRRLFYFHVLPERRLSLTLMRRDVPRGEAWGVTLAFPILRQIMKRAMRIDAEGAQRSREHVHRVWEEVDGLLADGRRYLVGDRFTAADLTFAALAAPVVRPTAHPISFADVESPDEIVALAERPAGRFIARLYDEHRRQAV